MFYFVGRITEKLYSTDFLNTKFGEKVAHRGPRKKGLDFGDNPNLEFLTHAFAKYIAYIKSLQIIATVAPVYKLREAATICPAPCKFTFDLLTLKVVSESRVTWATSVPILVFLGLSVLDLLRCTRQTDIRRQTRIIA